MEKINIGKLIKQEVKKQNLSNAEFGRRINTTGSNVKHIFERTSMDTDQLTTISEALKHNFFQYYCLDTAPEKKHEKKLMVWVEIDQEELIRELKRKVLNSL